jgi:hypothetical protein
MIMRRPVSALATALALLAAVPACTHHDTFVQADQAALGRVVVYRNGVAYYERHAKVDGDKLTLRVPGDKIDDFLKSLTVADAKTGIALPISFPSPGQARGAEVEMTIQLPDHTHHDILLSYVTDSPAWKPSYRVVVSDAGKVDLQGWAIVDNTSGEDWQAVQVGVGSSSALSFRFDLHSIRVVHRETLHSQDTFAKAPPMGGSVVRDSQVGEAVLAQLDDVDIPRPEGHPDVAFADEEMPVTAEKKKESFRGGSGRAATRMPMGPNAASGAPQAQHYRKAGKDQSADDLRVAALAASLKARRDVVLIEGYGAAGESDAQDRGLDRANMMRNQLIEKGVPPAQLKVVSRGVVAGQKAGVRLVEEKQAADSAKKSMDPEEIAGNPVGESHFESKTPMNVAKGTSAMVSIVQGAAHGDIVYLYDAESGRGDTRFAFRAVRFKNPTSSTLETGPMTVYGAGRFIGEGLTEPIPAGATAVVPFALDRQVVVDREGSTGDRMSQLLKVNRGVMTAEVQHWKLNKLKITNRLGVATTVLVKHTVPKGWTITRGPQVAEGYGDSRLFTVDLKGGETRTLEIEEATPLQRTVDLRTTTGVDLVRFWLDDQKPGGPMTDTMNKLLGLYNDMAKAQEMIEHLRERGDEFRVRMDELHAQIFSLKAVKTAGSLMTHLQQKMKEISDKVQQNTLDVVQTQEKLMLAKVRFQDELAELTLDRKPASQAAKN